MHRPCCHTDSGEKVMTGWSTLADRTPAEQRAARQAFRDKLAAAAVPDYGVSCPSASQRKITVKPVDNPPVIPQIEPDPDIIVIPPRVFERRRNERIAMFVQRTVALHFGISAVEIRSHDRSQHMVIPRCVAMHLLRLQTGKSLPWIGRQFNGRDHSTVINGLRKVAAMTQDPAFAAEVSELRAEIEAGLSQ
jgi:hypothetical protein